jgi:hypothetical protein
MVEFTEIVALRQYVPETIGQQSLLLELQDEFPELADGILEVLTVVL